ncbi:MAG: hypothetical protein FD127_4410, partial [Acidimicrobiaceae bacterium]
GWSSGGSTALQVCATEPRCAAVANLDGMTGRHDDPIDAPVLRFSGLRGGLHSAPGWGLVAERATGDATAVWIDGAGHFAFSSLLTAGVGLDRLLPCDAVGEFDCGPLDAARTQAIYQSMSEAFFLTHLLGEPPSALLTRASGVDAETPEVDFEQSTLGVTDGPLRVIGAARDAVEFAPIEDVEVTATAGRVGQVTADAGWRVDDLAPGTRLDVRLTSPGYWPWQTTVALGTRSAAIEADVVPRGLEAHWLGPIGLSAMRGRGHVVVVVYNYATDGASGVVLRGAVRPYYIASPGGASPTLEATDDAGLGLFVNVEPGTFVISFRHPSWHCAPVDMP